MARGQRPGYSLGARDHVPGRSPAGDARESDRATPAR